VHQSDVDRFELTELGESLRAGASDSAYAVLTMLCGPENWRSWGELVPGVRSGRMPWELAHDELQSRHGRAHARRGGGHPRRRRSRALRHGDARAAAILRNVRGATGQAARVLVVERMLPELVGEADVPTLLVDVLMLTVTGGRERTEREFSDLFAAAGFELATVTDRIPPFDYRVLEATPAPRA
jgi:hypothetical protein